MITRLHRLYEKNKLIAPNILDLFVISYADV